MKIINISIFLIFICNTIFAQKINNSFFGGKFSFKRESFFYDTLFSSIRNSNQNGNLYDYYYTPIYSGNTNILRFHPVWTRKTKKGNFKEWELTKLYVYSRNHKYQVKSDNTLPDSLTFGFNKVRDFSLSITNRTHYNVIKKYSNKFAMNIVFSKSLEFDNNKNYYPENSESFSSKAYIFRPKIGTSFGFFFSPKNNLLFGLNFPEYISLDIGLGRQYVHNYQIPEPLRGQTVLEINILINLKIQRPLNFPSLTFAYSF